ncbi:MAG: hypothetical protein ACI9YT_002914 [Halobacteriales archaeon]|jgi:hypothetical protein
MTDDTDAREAGGVPSVARLVGYGLLFAIGFVILIAAGRTAFGYFAGTLDAPYPAIRLGIEVMYAWIGSSLLLAGLYGPNRIAVAATIE